MSLAPVRMDRPTFRHLLSVLERGLVSGASWAAVLPSGRVVPLETRELEPGYRLIEPASLLLVARHPGCVVAHAHRLPPAVLSASDRLGAVAGSDPAYEMALVVVVPRFLEAAAYRWDASDGCFRNVPLIVSP